LVSSERRDSWMMHDPPDGDVPMRASVNRVRSSSTTVSRELFEQFSLGLYY
jgi:hypothetical protein